MSTLNDRTLAIVRERHPNLADLPDAQVKRSLIFAATRADLAVRELGGVTVDEAKIASTRIGKTGRSARDLIDKWRRTLR